MTALLADLTYTPAPVPEAHGVGHPIVQLFLLTGFVLAICLGLLWATRRAGRGAKPGAKSGDLEYVAAVALNGRCSLHMLKAGSQSVVIGSDLSGLKAMVVLPDSFDAALRRATAEASGTRRLSPPPATRT
jgi:flagellar biogenesis protein FliO